MLALCKSSDRAVTVAAGWNPFERGTFLHCCGSVINRGTPGEVKAHVLKRLDIFATGGGFVFGTVHNILPEVPPENIVAVFEAIKEFEGDC